MAQTQTKTKPKVSCINLGYYQVKANENICFKSMAKTTIDDNQISEGDTIKLNDRKYILEVGQPMLESDKTTSELTKVFVLNVLAKQMKEKNEETFNVLLTSPPVSFKRQRDELPLFLKGRYDIQYNGEEKSILINEVVVLPETFLIYTVNSPNKLKGKKTLIIDIGGRTTNVCLLTDCKFNLDDYITLPQGMYHIDTSIANEINSENYTSYNFTDIELLRKGNADLLIDNEDILDRIYTNHVEEILKQIQIKSWQIDKYSNILICGGGGTILEENIQQVFPNATLSNDPLFDNLKALEMLSKEIFK